ncbi:MAG: RNA polymerase sigma factor [Thermomicrobiales bacterium]
MRRRVKMAWYSLVNTVPRGAVGQTAAPPAETLPRASRSDEDYVRLVAQGEEEALRVLYERYAGLVFSLAAHKLGAGPAEELVQDVFLALWHKAGTFDPARGAFKHWFLRLAHRRIIDQWRASQTRGARQAQLTSLDELVLEQPAREALPEEQQIQREQGWAAAQALLTLPAEQRQVLLLGYVNGLSQTEMAAQLGIPLGTVKKRVRLGLGKLRLLLASKEEAR